MPGREGGLLGAQLSHSAEPGTPLSAPSPSLCGASTVSRPHGNASRVQGKSCTIQRGDAVTAPRYGQDTGDKAIELTSGKLILFELNTAGGVQGPRSNHWPTQPLSRLEAHLCHPLQ